MGDEEHLDIMRNIAYEIKKREFCVLDAELNSKKYNFEVVFIEFCSQQFRKICESLAHCAVAANAQAWKSLVNSLKTDFHENKTFNWF